MTNNHYLTSKIQHQRKFKFAQICSGVAKAAQVSWAKDDDESRLETFVDATKLDTDFHNGSELNMDKFIPKSSTSKCTRAKHARDNY